MEIDCEQSLFCSKIRGKNTENLASTIFERRVARARGEAASARAFFSAESRAKEGMLAAVYCGDGMAKVKRGFKFRSGQ